MMQAMQAMRAMRASAVGAVVVAAALGVCACSAGGADATNPGDVGGSGGALPPGCVLAIDAMQPLPAAGPNSTVHASVRISTPGASVAYVWQVQFEGAEVPISVGEGSVAIDFAVAAPGVYIVRVDLASGVCSSAIAPINIAAPGALSTKLRLRVVPPPASGAPSMEKLIDVRGGAPVDRGVETIDSGVVEHPVVLGPSGGVPAYLQFAPAGAPDAIVEAFSDGSGAAAVRLVSQPYAVLVIPSVDGVAPRRFTGWQPGQALQLDAGSAVSGTVKDPSGALLEGAVVRLTSDGVPSTLAPTGGDGGFALHAALGATATIEVAPPAVSGLPRLIATLATTELAVPLHIRYVTNLAPPVDLAGMVLQRGGAPLAGARLSVVGTLPVVGMVTGRTASVPASGEIRAAATAGQDGALPALRVAVSAAGAPLSAVIEAAPGDLAVVALDTSSGGAPASLDAPDMPPVATAVQDGGGAGLPGTVVDLVPTGALAMVNAPTLRLAAGAGGVIATTLPFGGHYELRFADPQGRGAPLIVGDREITAIAAVYQLPAALQISGTLRLDGSLALPNAAVQILCQNCSGIERSLPLVEVLSDAAGRFALAVPDPGTR
jgi:hypothetical protein